LAAVISATALSFSTPAAVVDSLAEDSFSFSTLSTSLECSAVLLSSPSACDSSAADFQKVLVALTKDLSKNFFF